MSFLVWIYGILLSGVVTLWSWNGAVVLPIIKKKFYKRVLTFMISLAFGTLTCNSLLKYVPLVCSHDLKTALSMLSNDYQTVFFISKADGFDEPILDFPDNTYFYKHLVILGVILFFFLFERTMKIITIFKNMVCN
jgi:hypothetical protein